MSAHDESTEPRPDLKKGVSLDALPDGGHLVGTVDKDSVLLVRRGDTIFAVTAKCTHYGGALGQGVIAGETVRCPLHHACFSLRTGEALGAPAFDPIACWRVERDGQRVIVREKVEAPSSAARVASASTGAPASIVIVGGGAAGFAAADMLRREGYAGPLTMLSADADAPYDRPNLSKDFLGGDMPADWLPLQTDAFYRDANIDLRLATRVKSIDRATRHVVLENGDRLPFGALLLATGAEPIRLSIPGADGPRVHLLRSLVDARAIVDRAKDVKRVALIGAGFIGLEVAASLRERGIDVESVTPERVLFERVMGPALGAFLQRLHESHGVVFHLGATATKIDDRTVTLDSGKTIEADLILIGVGVRPAIALAEQAGLTIDRGIAVDEYLETSVPGIFAAGDIARWPDRYSGDRIRVEHWVVAERQGQAAARNMLGQRKPFRDVPYFWTKQYDVTIRYTGHAEKWDDARVDGTLDGPIDKVACTVTFARAGRRLAVATIRRDLENLRAEVDMETGRP